MTREQREAKYREARERIFKDIEESERDARGPAAVHDGTIKLDSRSSSRTGKGRGASRRHRNHHHHPADDDGFQARSQFAPYYPASPPPPPTSFHQLPVMMPSFIPNPTILPTVVGHGLSVPSSVVPGFQPYPPLPPPPLLGGLDPSRPAQMAGGYVDPNRSHPDLGSEGIGPSFSATPGWSIRSGLSTSSDPLGDADDDDEDHHHHPTLGDRPTISTDHPFSSRFRQPAAHVAPPLTDPAWPSPALPYAFPPPDYSSQSVHRGRSDSYGGVPLPSGLIPSWPYLYGQLPPPSPAPGGGYRINDRHPIPGSFTRHAFNPRTQPFVPGDHRHQQHHHHHHHHHHHRTVTGPPASSDGGPMVQPRRSSPTSSPPHPPNQMQIPYDQPMQAMVHHPLAPSQSSSPPSSRTNVGPYSSSISAAAAAAAAAAVVGPPTTSMAAHPTSSSDHPPLIPPPIFVQAGGVRPMGRPSRPW